MAGIHQMMISGITLPPPVWYSLAHFNNSAVDSVGDQAFSMGWGYGTAKFGVAGGAGEAIKYWISPPTAPSEWTYEAWLVPVADIIGIGVSDGTTYSATIAFTGTDLVVQATGKADVGIAFTPNSVYRHFALSYIGGTYRGFLDGTLFGTITSANNVLTFNQVTISNLTGSDPDYTPQSFDESALYGRARVANFTPWTRAYTTSDDPTGFQT